MSPNEVVERLSIYPPYNPRERELHSHYRIHILNRLFQIFQPLPMNIDLENRISRVIRQGYIYRNPFGRELSKGFREDYKRMHSTCGYINNGYNTSACGFTLIGISGLGKTTALNHILDIYPQIISHSEYQGVPLAAYQVVWMKLECPFDGSIKGLLFDFFSQIDRLLGTNYYEKMTKTRATTDVMLTAMNQVIRSCSLGLLVIDEIQHLSTAKSGGSKRMLNFFVNLVNKVGVAVVMVGTPRSAGVLQSEFRQARRGIGIGGDMICDRLEKGKVWDLLINAIWHYQWTKEKTPLTKELNDAMYDETQGIPDLVTKLYAIVQAKAISSGKEQITTKLIRKVAKENLRLVQPMIKALRSGNLREIAKYEDISIGNVDFSDILNKTKQNIDMNYMLEKVQKNKEKENQSNKIVVKEENNKSKRPKAKKEPINPHDIRYIVNEAKKDSKSPYEALKESGDIITYDKDIFSGVIA
ncbi:MAG: ATP-binding protein [Firmicutes bacterium]|nr:ATP-binding protein [Bacillota bacterium]